MRRNIWGVTRQHTTKVGLTIVPKARSHLVKLQLWNRTCSLIGEKTHTCSECKKLFGLDHNLKTARCKERAHSRVQCNNCFGQAASLKTPMITRSGVKSHTCRQPIAVSDISIYICLIDIRSNSDSEANPKNNWMRGEQACLHTC